jgi:lipopolysaccharide/colanic/teichoic acid biosynthesis glycosyltransferase
MFRTPSKGEEKMLQRVVDHVLALIGVAILRLLVGLATLIVKQPKKKVAPAET